MKINEGQRIGAVNSYTKVNDNKSANTIGKKEKPKDQVEISSEAQELLGAQGVSRTDEQAIRIDELKSAVTSGTYQVDARKIAEKLLPYIK
jgi:negative regulator of flagellin synthesis FlgM